MKHKLTDRQLVALLAVYHGQRISDEPSGVYGEAHEQAGQPYWRARTNMGGAIHRMAETLRDSGFVTEGDHYSLRDKPWYDRPGHLTVKAYEAIEERRGKLPVVNDRWDGKLPQYDFNVQLDAATLQERKERRREREAEITRLIADEQAQARAQRERNAAEAKDRKLARLRELFGKEGLADNWSDDQLLTFSDKVASIA